MNRRQLFCGAAAAVVAAVVPAAPRADPAPVRLVKTGPYSITVHLGDREFREGETYRFRFEDGEWRVVG